MIKLTKTEKDEIVKLSTDFVSIHQEMRQIEGEIEKLRKKADLLEKNLNGCREKEKKFTKKLYSKYGEGRLDPINLEWVSGEMLYVSQNK